MSKHRSIVENSLVIFVNNSSPTCLSTVVATLTHTNLSLPTTVCSSRERASNSTEQTLFMVFLASLTLTAFPAQINKKINNLYLYTICVKAIGLWGRLNVTNILKELIN